MLTAGALLLEPDYTEVELIYSRDEYREAWAAVWRERERERSERDDSKKPTIGFARQCSHQKLTSISREATCQGICSDVSSNVANITCLLQSFLMEVNVEVTSLQLDENQ